MLYIGNTASDTDAVSSCRVVGRALTDCKVAAGGLSLFQTVFGITIYQSHAYISTQRGVTVCATNPSGLLTGCTLTVTDRENVPSYPTDIAFLSGRAWLVLGNENTIFVCPLSGPSIVDRACTDLHLNSVLSEPFDLSFTPDGKFAFIANRGNAVTSMTVCAVTAEGNGLENCAYQGTSFTSPISVAA